MAPITSTEAPAEIELVGPTQGVLTIKMRGGWAGPSESVSRASEALLDAVRRAQETDAQSGATFHVELDGDAVTIWDTRALVALASASELAKQLGLEVGLDRMQDGMRDLLRLSRAVPPRGERRSPGEVMDFLSRIGSSAVELRRSLADANVFFGQSLLSLWRFVRGKARFQGSDLVEFIQATGPEALSIVGLINVLLGIILGFMGAIQLRQFGAQIFVADLVSLATTREIAPMMTAIIIAGRTGAAYAAQLGTMQVNEEIDALKTFGFAPMDFLVLPRMLALVLMFPLLVLYADALGIFGGYLVGVAVLDLSSAEYIGQTRSALGLADVGLGLVKGSVFGALVAITGCMHGMQSGRSASAVGDAATRAVVSGITAIILMTAVFAVITNALGI